MSILAVDIHVHSPWINNYAESYKYPCPLIRKTQGMSVWSSIKTRAYPPMSTNGSFDHGRYTRLGWDWLGQGKFTCEGLIW